MNAQERNDDTPTQPLGGGRGDRRFTRARDDRMIAGVAGGLGRYFEVDPLIIRIGFAVSVFFGGLGILAYAILALFVPSDPEEPGAEVRPAPVQRSRWVGLAAIAAVVLIAVPAAGSLFFWADPWPWDGGGWGFGWGLGWALLLAAIAAAVYVLVKRDRESEGRSDFGRVIGVALVAVAGVFGLAILAAASAWVAAVGSGSAIAVAVIAIGALLVVAAFFGSARWLIAPALALAIPLAAVSAADVSFAGGIGEREYAPASRTALPDEGYELGVGRLAVDLRNLEWRRSEVLELDVDLGVGQALIAVPERVCVAADLRSGLGEVAAASERASGFDAERTVGVGARGTPRLELDGEVDLGAIRVLSDDDVDLDEQDRHGWRDWHEDTDDAARAAADRACSGVR